MSEVIEPVSVEQFGPGVDLSVLSGGISVKFDDLRAFLQSCL